MTLPQPVVELFLAGVWTNITPYVRIASGINISRGRSDEQSAPNTATCRLVLTNDGRFSPMNTAGPYYGQLTIGTQIRITYLSSVRFIGAVYEWPVSWSPGPSDTNRLATIVANGVRRRLQHNTALQSPYRRAVLGKSNVLAYWPMEDGAAAATFAPAIGVNVGTFTGAAVALAADSTWPASLPLPTMGNLSVFTYTFPQYTPAAGGQQVRWLQKASVAAGPVSLAIQIHTSGAHLFELDYAPTADTWRITMINQSTGATEYDSGAIGGWFGQGIQSMIQFTVKQNGTGIDYGLAVLPPSNTSGLVITNTIPSATLGLLTYAQFFNGTAMATTIGHLTMENQQTSIFDTAAALDGYAGETAYARAVRLAAEEGVTLDHPAVSASTLIGPQGELSVIALIDEAADVDGGLSTEDVDAYGLLWRGRRSIMGAAPTLTLARTDLLDVQTTYDDSGVLNDVTVTRPAGSSARSTQVNGNRGITAIGTYSDAVSLNVNLDSDLRDAADARLSAGQMDEPRLPSVVFDALGTVGTTGPKAIREGDTVTVTGFTAGSGVATSATYLLVGWKELITEVQWLFDLNTQPHPLARVFVLDSPTLGTLDINRLGY